MSLFIGCNSDRFFHMGAPDYIVRPRTFERSHGKTSGSCDWLMATCYDMLEHVAWRSAICLGMDEGCFDHEVPMVGSFDILWSFVCGVY